MDKIKPKTSLSKFEEFFSTIYKDNVFEILEKYPDERTLIIDYNDLEMFDIALADLLIEKPDEVILASQKAIKNIDPLMKDAELNIRFENLTNSVSLRELSSRHIGNLISIKGIIKNVSKDSPRIETGVFECIDCMRLHEVEQTSGNRIKEPSLCSECGGRSFRLLQEESKYIDTQLAILSNSYEEFSEREHPTELDVIFEDDLVNKVLRNDMVELIGTLKTFREKSGKFRKYLYVNNIIGLPPISFSDEKIDDEISRNNPEYNKWREDVLNRDKVCQCCGLEKRLQVHHIFGYKEYPELALDTGNGIVLCQFCHDKYHSIYGLKEINPVKFAKFMRRFSRNG